MKLLEDDFKGDPFNIDYIEMNLRSMAKLKREKLKVKEEDIFEDEKLATKEKPSLGPED
jgi:hypothetical protein